MLKIEKIMELIERDDLASKDRYRDMIYKRSFLYGMLKENGWHLAKIGKLFNRSHATVINALKIYEQFYKHDKLYDSTIKHYVKELLDEEVEIDEDKPSIYQDIMNCHNTTELMLIKQRILAGKYDR
jgi:sarcosine oxidase delta subunit